MSEAQHDTAEHLVPNASAPPESDADVDARCFALFASPALHKLLLASDRVNLPDVWARVESDLGRGRPRAAKRATDGLSTHHQIVAGLPGEALFIAAAMAFDSVQEALPFFEVSAKTAKARLGRRLATSEGEVALRIARVVAVATTAFASAASARTFLQTPNFALGGAVPRDLLKTAEGERLVLAELQTMAQGGPV